MKKLLLSSLVLLSVIQLKAAPDKKHIRTITLAALQDPKELDTRVNVQEKTLQFYSNYGKEDLLTVLQLKHIKKAFRNRMNRRSVKNFKKGKDLPKDRVALSRKHKKSIVNARQAVLNAIIEQDPNKLSTACEDLTWCDENWHGSQDKV